MPSHAFLRLAALFLLALILLLPGTAALPLLDRDETYYAEVSREMNERGDYVVPYFNGKPWLEKTPLLYWAQAAAFRGLGENEFAARLPGVLASAATALFVFGFCSSLYGAEAAWKAAGAFLLCAQVLVFGRAGITDMLLTAFTTLAAWAGWEMCQSGGRKVWWWVFYASLAGAALAKGPVAVIPLGAALLFAWGTRTGGVWRWVNGLPLTALLAGAWFVAVMVMTDGDFYQKFFVAQVFHKFSNSQQGHGAATALAYVASLPFYFVILPVAFLPWTFYLLPAYRRMKTQRTRADGYLACGILLTFGLFTLLRTKLPHYTLPAFPLIACAVAPSLPGKAFLRLGAAAAAINVAAAVLLAPLAAKYSTVPQLVGHARLTREMSAAVADYSEPGLVWSLRGRVRSPIERIKASKAVEFMSEPGARLCVMPTETAAKLPLDPAWEKLSVRGIDAVHGKWIGLTMLVKTAPEAASAATP
jgi:4-amino-4-deoxy-L-arabinose transferase-like glycosyltransferase